MDVAQYREYVVRATLKEFSVWSKEAEDLVVGTALVESGGLKYIKQLNGPALGFIQMEPATYKDLWHNYIAYKEGVTSRAIDYWGINVSMSSELLLTDLKLGAFMCRMHYMRVKSTLPTTLEDQAKYWKDHYNTYLGKGTVDKYLIAWHRFNKNVP